jgi:sugar lactone lactonase YvrE
MGKGTVQVRTLVRGAAAVMAASLLLVGLSGTGGADDRRDRTPPHGRGERHTLTGIVEGAGAPQPGYRVRLYADQTPGRHRTTVLGTDVTDQDGRFEIAYRLPSGRARHGAPVTHLVAEKGSALLASALGDPTDVGGVVVNERTTVATGTSFAQFVDGRRLEGNRVGMGNAVRMTTNMADPVTGAIGSVLDEWPNAEQTSTRETFNTLANMVAACVADRAACTSLLRLSAPPGGPPSSTVLQAVANLTRYPQQEIPALFDLAAGGPFTPALTEAPSSWLLFLKFTGGDYYEYDDTNLMSGPGNVAFDREGVAWINDNYVPSEELQLSCAGLRLLKFHPWGEPFADTPYVGGGLSGAGFGITIDTRGGVWVGNFGFEAPSCDGSVPPDPERKIPATHDSVSLFRPDGTPVSPDAGFTRGGIWWPQATVADPRGNVWTANCGNDTVSVIPRGNPRRARNIPLPGGQGANGNLVVELPQQPRIKPFGLAIDPDGRAWVTGNADNEVYVVSPDGRVEVRDTRGLLLYPMGISGDSRGNMWVSSSGVVDIPCVTPFDPPPAQPSSVVLFPADGSRPKAYTGGGITIPWGNTVDGDDTVWVFNFGHNPLDALTTPDTSVSRFCGTDRDGCPHGTRRGEPISGPSGYVSDALDRVTGGGIDPSGNLWLMNNWKKLGPTEPVYNTNPGGNSFVIVPGAAAPVQTPLIGPPRGFDD